MNRFYEENGYLLVRGVFDAGDVDAMRDAITRILETVAATEHDSSHTWSGVDQSLQLKGFHDLQYHDATFTRMVSHPRLVEILTELIGPNVQLHHSKMLVKPPEQGAPFPMHQDYPYFPHERHTVLAASVHLDEPTRRTAACASSRARTSSARCRPKARRTRSTTRSRVGRRARPRPGTSCSSTI